jgi:hypothetical protein
VRKQPEEEDDEFIRMRQETPAARSEREQDEPEPSRGPDSYPSPGHV